MPETENIFLLVNYLSIFKRSNQDNQFDVSPKFKKMDKSESHALITDHILIDKIFTIRGYKVMFDKDLAELYGVETKRLNEQVKRNLQRFPAHFMFVLTREEQEASRSQNATLKQGKNIKFAPTVFTEHGILMLANVIKSQRAIEMSIRIIDIFVRIREMITDRTELQLEIEKIKQKINEHSENLETVFSYLDKMVAKIGQPESRQRIGFKPDILYSNKLNKT